MLGKLPEDGPPLLSLFQAPAEQIWRRPSGRLKSRIGGRQIMDGDRRLQTLAAELGLAAMLPH
jgi:hypothetical protein